MFRRTGLPFATQCVILTRCSHLSRGWLRLGRSFGDGRHKGARLGQLGLGLLKMNNNVAFTHI